MFDIVYVIFLFHSAPIVTFCTCKALVTSGVVTVLNPKKKKLAEKVPFGMEPEGKGLAFAKLKGAMVDGDDGTGTASLLIIITMKKVESKASEGIQ